MVSSTAKSWDLAQSCLYVVHRLFLVTYFLYSFVLYPALKSLRSRRTINGPLKKKPKHLLIKMDLLVQGKESERLMEDCIRFAEDYGIDYLTIIDKRFKLGHELGFLREVNLYCNHEQVHNGDGKTSVNVVSADQKQHFIKRLKGFSESTPEFRFGPDNLLPSVTPFPLVDLILSTSARPTYAGTLPPQIGFAEIYHMPGRRLTRAVLEEALDGYSKCTQNFGK